MPRRTSRRSGPPTPIQQPAGLDGGSDCRIEFGHRTDIKRVLMQFSMSCERLVFTPEQAEQVAAQLSAQAAYARGTQ